IYEQVLLGALDTGKWALAHRMLSELQKQLPATSQRLVRLTGMMHEAKGEYAEAWNVYQRMLSADESSVYAMKRKIAVLRAAPVEHIVDDSNDDGKGSNIVSCGPAAAVRALTEYLDIHAIDHEAWMELADCYLALNMYRQALFCLDEVMLLIPQNHIPQLKAAETLYSIGHLASALKRFCRALELCPDNVRALYGIQLCLARLLNR
ncbi:TPR-like protein, partial [Ramicandelaber brevisporus]